MRHWRPYLWGRAFVVRTDHYVLKFMLDQRLSTLPQHHWISKLFGFDFRVECRLGRLNTVADALSRHDGKTLGCAEGAARCLDDAAHGLVPTALAALSSPSFQLFEELHREMAASLDLSALRDAAAM